MSEQSKRLVSGAVVLSVSGLIVKVLSLFYKFYLINLVGTEVMGHYNIAYPVYLFLTAAALVGIPNSLAKLIAEERGASHYRMAHQTFRAGFLISAIFGLVMSFVLLLLPSFSIVLGWETETKYFVWGLTLAPVFISLSGPLRGYFQGFQEMAPTAVSQVIENIVRVIPGLLLVYWLLGQGYRKEVALAGSSVAITLGLAVSFIYLLVVYFKKRQAIKEQIQPQQEKLLLHQAIKKILIIAIPMTISSAALSMMGLIDSLTVNLLYIRNGLLANQARQAMGEIGSVQTVINVPLVLSVALAMSIVPAIAKERYSQPALVTKINESLQFAMKFALPSAVGISILAVPILALLFPSEVINPNYLRLYSVALVFMVLAQVTTSILQGLSGYFQAMWAVLIAAIGKLVLNIILVNQAFGGAGVIIASMVFFLLVFFLNSVFLHGRVKVMPDWSNIVFKPMISSGLMGIAVWVVYQLMMVGLHRRSLAVIVSVAVGMLVYFIVLGGLKGFSEEEKAFIVKFKRRLIRKKRASANEQGRGQNE